MPGAEEAGAAAQKKALHASERDAPRVRRRRRRWAAEAKQVPAKKLVFVDESGINTSMTRTRGRAAPGERVNGAAPQGHWKVMTAVAAIRLDGLTAPFTIDCPMDGEIFSTYVRRVLVPTLR